MGADARVTIDGDASGLTRALALGANSVRDFANSVGSALGPLKSLADVPLQQGRINFSGQAAQVREFEASSARLAVSMQRDLGQVRASLNATGMEIGKRPQEVAAWTAEVGKLTYNYAGAAEAMKGINGLAAMTGRQTSEYRGLAVELANVGKVGGDTANVIGVIAAQSEQLKNQGGVAAFTDQIEGLSDSVSRFAIRSQADFTRVTALAGELGKGLSPQAAQRVQGSAFGALAADPLRWERYLGRQLTDDHGQIKDPAKVMEDIVAKTKGRYGKDARRVLMLNFGAEAGAAMYSANYKEAAKLAGIGPSDKPAAAAAAYLSTDAGKRDKAEATLAVSSEKLLGSATMLGRAADALQRFAASNPVTSSMATAGIGAGVSAGIGGIVSKATKGGGLIKAAAGSGGALGLTALGLGSVIAAGVGGVVLANEWDKAQDERYEAQMRAASSEQANKINLSKMQTERKKKIAQLEAQGVSHGKAVYMTDLPGAGAQYNAPGAPARGGSSIAGGAGSAADADRNTKQIVDAVNRSKQITIINSTGGPIEVAEQGAQSAGAGNQSHG